MGDCMKEDFPIFSRMINGRPLVYLDNAATTQKPACVIDAMSDYYSSSNATYTAPYIHLQEKPQKDTKPVEKC